jgi:nitrite reductase/ring-hydroxylating ferredoxin subunit
MRRIAKIDDYKADGIYPLTIDEEKYLLIKSQNTFSLLEDKCGHFELSMVKGELKEGAIICPHHGISFDISSGEIVNRPWETCDSIKVIEMKNDGEYLFLI